MSLLRDTEAQFENFSPAKRWLVTLGAAAMIAALGYYLWIEPMEREIETQQGQIAQLQRQIAQVNLRRITDKLAQVKRQRLGLQEELERADAARRYLQSRARALDFIWFEQKSFLEMLDRVLRRSVELGIRLDLLETFDIEGEVTPLIEKKRRVLLEGAGRFADIVRLVHYIESFNALLKVVRFEVFLDDEGQTRFRTEMISYGAKL
ncbi:type II secretion system protein GspM [Hydrogenimonas sp.]